MKTIHYLIRTLCVLIVACGGFAAAPAHAQAPVLVPSTTEQADGQVRVVFATTAGKSYRIQHTIDLASWTYFPESIYGFGQTVRYAVHDLPAPTAAAASPPPAGPRPSEFLFFMITSFSDGSAVAGWAGQDGSQQKAYLPTFDLRYLGQRMQEMVEGTITPTAPALPYSLDVWSWSSPKDPSVVNLQASPTEAARLAKLTNQYTWVYNTMKARVDYRAANPGPPPSPPKLFDDAGQPLKQFFRVYESTTDSNFDGIADHLQFGNGGNPFNMDIDADGIPNGYDRDLWPAATFPATNALLNNVLINEALLGNEFTNGDDSTISKAEDWVELYNPTNATIDLSGWFLSDSSGPTGRMKWVIPPGTTIGSGQFRVIWASGNNRGGIEDRNGNGTLDAGEDLPNNGVLNGVLDPPRALHTSFSYSSGDSTIVPPTNPEPVVLSRPNAAVPGTAIIVDSYIAGATANYAQQRTDVSFGRFPSSTGLQTGYMILPTPGAVGVVGTGSLGPVGQHNVVGALGFTDPPTWAATSSIPGLYEATTITAALAPPATGGVVHFTTNSVNPTRYSELYSGPITASRTKVIRAIAAREGYLPSASVTRSYMFKEDILGTSPQGTAPTDQQGARETSGPLTGQFKGLLYGYPEATEISGYPLRYEMHPDVVRDKKNAMAAELSNAAVVSMVSNVSDLMDVQSAGIYPNSGKTDNYWAGRGGPDPRSRDWARLCSFELSEKDKSGYVQGNACLSMTGGSSLYQDVTRKHNFRVKFDSSHGPKSLVYPLFTDAPVVNGNPLVEYFTFHFKNPTHDSWSQTYFAQYEQASYCDEGWMRSAHRLMGHDNPRRRWVHLFLNGIYWGPYEMTERVDSDFIRSHAGAPQNATYDVLKQASSSDPANANGVAAIDGTTTAWDSFITLCTSLSTAVSGGQPIATQDALYQQVLAAADIDNFIDYLLVYAYAQGYDWPTNNFRIVRRNNLGDLRFKFYVWDSEWAFQPNEQTLSGASRIVGGGVARPHSLLLSYLGYKRKFAERIRYHFHEQATIPGSGALAVAATADKAVQLYQAEMNKFDDVLFCESARWGYLKKAIPFTLSDPSYLPTNTTKGDWQRTTNHIVNTWLPGRRNVFFGHFATANLYVAIAPVALAVPQVGTAYNQALTVTGGTSPRTLALASGTLPPGLVLGAAALTGTPTTAGTYTFTISATSTDNLQGLTRYAVTVTP